jgi:hypothetical protein
MAGVAGRRRVLRYIGAVIGVAVIAIAGLIGIRRVMRLPAPTPTPTPPVVKPPEISIMASRVPRVPIDPDAPEWGRVREYTVELGPQAMAYPVHLKPAVTSLKVRVAHDGELIGFRLEWSDPKLHVDVLDVNRFADQCAVLLLSSKVPKEKLPIAWQMGAPEWPATILSWRADWQEDVDKGFREIEHLYPNIAVDGYTPYDAIETVKDLVKPRRVSDMPPEARKWLAGMSAGNIMSEFERRSPVAKLLAKGPGTITPFKTQDALGKGVWRDGIWRVVLAKRLKASDEMLGELSITPGDTFYVAFAVWEGGAGERGGRKAISQLILAGLET